MSLLRLDKVKLPKRCDYRLFSPSNNETEKGKNQCQMRLYNILALGFIPFLCIIYDFKDEFIRKGTSPSFQKLILMFSFLIHSKSVSDSCLLLVLQEAGSEQCSNEVDLSKAATVSSGQLLDHR